MKMMNEPIECTCGACGHEFEAVPQPKHKLLCGDSTRAEDVARLLDGQIAALCLTDPPYGIGESYDQHKDTKESLRTLIDRFLPLACQHATVVLLTPGTSHHRAYPDPTWTLAWACPAGTGVGPWGFCCWQPILAYGKDPYLAAGKGSRPDFLNHTESAEKDLAHPCPKPVGVWTWLLERGSVNEGDVVFDPFCGSGTTLLAAEKTGRLARGLELSAAYCSVALQRYENATGDAPYLIERIDEDETSEDESR